MINRATADLGSATHRVRFFGGRAADAVAAEMPILPVDAPGIPPPGPSLVRFARLMGDDAPNPITLFGKSGRPLKRTRPGRPGGPNLTALVRSALYQSGTAVRLEEAGSPETYEFMPGVVRDADGARQGPSRCRLVVVGKCVGRSEVAAQQPFCGPGSDPLWRAWREAGLPDPGRGLPTFLTNLLRFDPPASVMTRLPREWVADGLHLLYQELAVCRPEFVLLLGADALKAVFGQKAKVGDYKGRVADLEVDCRPTADTPDDRFVCRVVVADHPAAVHRDPDRYPSFLGSLRFLARHLGFAPPVESVTADYQAVLTLDELRAAVADTERASAGGGYVAFDCEWEGRHPTEPGSYLYTVQWSHAPGHARVAYLRRCGGAENPGLTADRAAPLLRRLLAGAPKRGARLVGHFAKADLPWLESVGVDLYPHFVGPRDDPGADGSADRLWAWQKCYFEGAFDTYVAAQSVDENQPRGLESLTSGELGMDRYDLDVEAWKEEYRKSAGLKKMSDIRGFGNVPEHRMTPYAAKDCDGSGRLYLLYNGDPRAGTRGRLDADRFGNSCRQIFATRMRAWAAVAEMERYGLEVDRDAHRSLREAVAARRDELLAEFRGLTDWPEFSPSRRADRVEFLFGETFSPGRAPVRPPGALSLYLTPYKATATGGGRLWPEAVARYERDGGVAPEPAADKETLINLSRGNDLVARLLDIDFLSTAMKIVFRPPDAPKDQRDKDGDGDAADAGDREERYSRGFLAEVHHDGRVRTRIGHVETGRYSSSGPNMQNFSSAVDEKYERILGWGPFAPEGSPNALRRFVTRSVVRARPGWYLVAADLKGAEVAVAGWFSGDAALIADAARATLDEDDPDYLDLHSDLANKAFKLGLTLKEVKKKHKPLRVAAKKTRFSHYYGASVDTIYRQVLQETTEVTPEQIAQLVRGHDEQYPDLSRCFAGARSRPARKGWLCNGYGGYRRFRQAVDRDLQAAQEREAQNWLCQGAVADHVATALGDLWYEFRDRGLRSRIVLTVHDSIVCECPPDEVALVAREVLPRAMTSPPFVVTDFDGNPLPRGPYHFGVDVGVYRNWEVEVPESEWAGA